MKVIINADDLGASPAVNAAIFELMAGRFISSATVMANAPAVEEAVRTAATMPECSFGVHLNLTQFRSLTRSVGLTEILNESGMFRMSAAQIRKVKTSPALRRAIFDEWSAQISTVRSMGLRISHLDSHHQVHTIPGLFRVLKKVQARFGIRKVRLAENLYQDTATVPRRSQMKKHLWNFALRNYYRTTTTEAFMSLLGFLELTRCGLPRYRIIELMTHPGADGYEAETALLRTPWRDRVTGNVEIISYDQLG